MSEQPTSGVFNMSRAELYHNHLYKELMTSEERQGRYQLLIISGATPSQARSWRDWSPNHYQQMLDYLLKPKTPPPGVSQFD